MWSNAHDALALAAWARDISISSLLVHLEVVHHIASLDVDGHVLKDLRAAEAAVSFYHVDDVKALLIAPTLLRRVEATDRDEEHVSLTLESVNCERWLVGAEVQVWTMKLRYLLCLRVDDKDATVALCVLPIWSHVAPAGAVLCVVLSLLPPIAHQQLA